VTWPEAGLQWWQEIGIRQVHHQLTDHDPFQQFRQYRQVGEIKVVDGRMGAQVKSRLVDKLLFGRTVYTDTLTDTKAIAVPGQLK